MYFVAPAIFILGIGAYGFLAIFYPEWVGITGKVAQKNLEQHKDEQIGDTSPNTEADPPSGKS